MSFHTYPDSSEGKSRGDVEEKTAQNFIMEKQARTEEILARLKRNSPLAYGYAMLIYALINETNYEKDD